MGLAGSIAAILLSAVVSQALLTPLFITSGIVVILLLLAVTLYFLRDVQNERKTFPRARYDDEEALRTQRLEKLLETFSGQVEYTGVAGTFIFYMYDRIVSFLARDKGNALTVIVLDPGVADERVTENNQAPSIIEMTEFESSDKAAGLAEALLNNIPQCRAKGMESLAKNTRTILGAKNKHEATILASALMWVGAWAQAVEAGSVEDRFKLIFTPHTRYKAWFFRPHLCFAGFSHAYDVGTMSEIFEYAGDDLPTSSVTQYYLKNTAGYEQFRAKAVMNGIICNSKTPKETYEKLLNCSERILGVYLEH